MRWLLVFVLLVGQVWAQAGISPCGPAQMLEWDYQPNPYVGSFFVYVSAQSGVYPISAGGPIKSRPTKIVSAYPSMVLQVSCADLQLSGPGPWYSVVTAVSVDMTEESGTSNELVLSLETPLPKPPKPPKLPPLPVPPIGKVPPPIARPVLPQVSLPPLGPSPGGGLTQTDVWQGKGSSGVPPSPTKPVPGAPVLGSDSLTTTCVWQGKCPSVE